MGSPNYLHCISLGNLFAQICHSKVLPPSLTITPVENRLLEVKALEAFPQNNKQSWVGGWKKEIYY